MKQRKRAPGAGRPPGELGAKRATLSLRLPADLRIALVTAAEQKAAEQKKKVSVSGELVHRVRSTFGRSPDRPAHIAALMEAIASIAQGIERKTELPWTADQFTAERLSRAISLFITHYSPQGTETVPPAVVEAAKGMPPQLRDAYPALLGEWEAGAVISSINTTPEPPEVKWPDTVKVGGQDVPVRYPESWWGPWRIRKALKQEKAQ
jgi:hypothetical protein